MAKSNKKMWLTVLAVAVVLVGAGGYLWHNGWQLPGLGSNSWSNYQAIFLSNGQVYFGKASRLTGAYVKLTDVYYLQVNQTLQPAGKTTTPQQSISLAKLGLSEIHKPTDMMLINREQVLFIETMGPDSQVVEAIKAYKESLDK